MNADARTDDEALASIVYVAESPIHGRGLFAARRIRRGEYIGTFAGPEAQRNGRYVLWVYAPDDPDGAIGRIGRNMLRFVNHASSWNAHFDEFALFASRQIRRGEEITIDYGDAE